MGIGEELQNVHIRLSVLLHLNVLSCLGSGGKRTYCLFQLSLKCLRLCKPLLCNQIGYLRPGTPDDTTMLFSSAGVVGVPFQGRPFWAGIPMTVKLAVTYALNSWTSL